jgi:hypothetical protein
MRAVGRNDPCPCGSGRKHKRCCLDAGRGALRLAADLESRVLELGDEARRRAPAAWTAAFDEQIGPVGRFGVVDAQEAAWLDTWLVCDAPIGDGPPPIDAAADPSPVDEALRQSSIGGWWARGADFPLDAVHWRFDEPATLHSRHEPLGTLREGALVVARGLDTGLGHVALVGRPVVVADECVGDVLAQLRRAPDRALCASVRWPEERTHTAEGELVQQYFRSYSLAEPEAAIATLRGAPGVTERFGEVSLWENDVLFRVHGSPLVPAVVPPAEPGVVWHLCDEDREDPRVLGDVCVSPEDGDLSLSAPTPSRVERLLDALPESVVDRLGEVCGEELDAPDLMRRVQRERLAALV